MAVTSVGIPLDRIILDRIAVCPRSAMLRMGAGDRRELRTSPWWVYVASESLPEDLGTSHSSIGFRGETAGGPAIDGEVRIVGRCDDAYGTELILSGLRPLGTEADPDTRS